MSDAPTNQITYYDNIADFYSGPNLVETVRIFTTTPLKILPAGSVFATPPLTYVPSPGEAPFGVVFTIYYSPGIDALVITGKDPTNGEYILSPPPPTLPPTIQGDATQDTGIVDEYENDDTGEISYTPVANRGELVENQNSLTITATDANKLANTPPASTELPPNTIPPPTTTPFTFTVTRGGDTSQAEAVNYVVTGSGPNPVPVGDFQGGTSGTIKFAAGQATQTLTINLGPHVTLAKPNDGFTVTVTDPSGNTASATGNVQGVGAPSPALLVDLANASYSPSVASVDGYTGVSESNPANTTGFIEPASPNLGGTPNGFYAEAFQDGNQVVVAIRGTDPSNLSNLARNLWQDASWSGITPNNALSQDVQMAATFLAQVKAKFPNATLTLTGHSLGGAIAQLLSDASGIPATVFNAPGAKLFENALATQLGPAKNLNAGAAPGADTNYRVYGDQISLAGSPIGQQVTLASPYGGGWANALSNHLMPAVFMALRHPDRVPPDSSLVSQLLVPSLTANPNVQSLAPTPVKSGQQGGLDPSGANTFTVNEAAGSVPLSNITLPTDPMDGVVNYSLRFLSGNNQVISETVAAGQTVTVPSGVDGFSYTGFDANGDPVATDGIIGLTFGATGTFGATITASNTTRGIFSGSYPNGILLNDPTTQNPATITSTASVTNTGDNDSVSATAGFAWTVTNNGTISGPGNGIHLADAGTVDNGGSIAGANGIVLDSGGTVTNSGTIAGSGNGVEIGAGAADGSTVTNQGTISGNVGFMVDAGNTADNMLTNAGTISGDGGTAVRFRGGDDLLTVDPNAVFVGRVNGGAGYDAIELAAGGGVGTLLSLGTQFRRFEAVYVDPGAVWHLAGAPAAPPDVANDGRIVTGNGNGLVLGAVSEDPGSSGVVAVRTGGSVEFTGGVDSQQTVRFADNTGALILDDPQDFAATIRGFQIGDTIDLTNVAVDGFTYANGALTLTSGGNTAATLTLFGNLGGSQFALASDGQGGTLVTATTQASAAQAYVPFTTSPGQSNGTSVLASGSDSTLVNATTMGSSPNLALHPLLAS